jgi:hypothetical protein
MRSSMRLLIALALAATLGAAETAERWGVYAVWLAGPASGNPFPDVQLTAEFRLAGRTVDVTGFYDGGSVSRIQCMPDSAGEWTYTTSSNAPALDGKTGGSQPITVRCGCDTQPTSPMKTALIDPWEMMSTALGDVSGGKLKLKLPGRPFVAVRFVKTN